MTNQSKFRRTWQVLSATALLVGSFAASAATIMLSPASQIVADSATFTVDINAIGLPPGTPTTIELPMGSGNFVPTGSVGGGLNVRWNAADMTLDSVVLNTTDWGFFGSSVGVDDGFGNLTNVQFAATTPAGFPGDSFLGTLTFTLGTGVADSVISMDAIGATDWAVYAGGAFTNTYESAIVNPSEVPLPAAAWLFGSGLLGLVGVRRRAARVA